MLYLICFLILLIDQITKYYAVSQLQGQAPIVLINNFLQLNYVENYGAAFGILQNKKIFFVIITLVVLIGIVVYLKTNTKLHKLMRVSLVMIMAGALGNIIDRIRLGFVVDFIDVRFGNLYDYPVFNIADSAIVIATMFIAYLVLFDKYQRD